MNYYGDILSGATLEVFYYSYNSLGASATPSSAGSVIVYKTASATQTSVGIVTHTIGYDSQTGVNRVVIQSADSAAFYASGNDFQVIASGSSIDGQFVNVPVCAFSIQNRWPWVATTEPGAVPSSTSNMDAKLNYLFAKSTNSQSLTSSTGSWILRNAGNSATIAGRTDFDASGVYTKGKEA